jgi:hypothetical protein
LIEKTLDVLNPGGVDMTRKDAGGG